MKKEWHQSTLGELCKAYGGKIQTGPFGSQLHQSDYSDDGIPVVMPKDIDQQGIDLSSVAKVSLEIAARLSRHKLHKDEIVFPRRGEITKCALIKQDQEGFLCGTGCLKITIPSKILSPLFIRYYLAKQEIIEWLDSNAVGATMKNLSTGILEKLPVYYPPLPIQEKIAWILAVYDDLIENNLKRIKLLEEMAQITYEEWFVRMRFPGHESVSINLGTGLPEGWKRKENGDCCEVSGGGTPSREIPEYWESGTVKWFSPTDLSKANSLCLLDSSDKITELGFKKSSARLMGKHTFMMTSRATIGLFGLIDAEYTTNQGFINVTPLKPHHKYYLLFNFKNRVDEFIAHASGATFPEISKSNFKRLKITWPSEDALSIFHEYCSPIIGEMMNLTKQNQRLREARDILLPRLMTGVIDVESYNPAQLLKEVA